MGLPYLCTHVQTQIYTWEWVCCCDALADHSLVLLATELQRTCRIEFSRYPLSVFKAAACPAYFKIRHEYFFQGKYKSAFPELNIFSHLTPSMLQYELCLGYVWISGLGAARSFHLSRRYNPALGELRYRRGAQIELASPRLACLVGSFGQSLWCSVVGVQLIGRSWF